jgi:hypothetical protein
MPRAPPDLVVKSHLRKHASQVVDVHSRGKALAASHALSALACIPNFLVQFHTQLRGTLENMNKLAEW